jgi:hypothetical protein
MEHWEIEGMERTSLYRKEGMVSNGLSGRMRKSDKSGTKEKNEKNTYTEDIARLRVYCIVEKEEKGTRDGQRCRYRIR